LRLGRSRGRDSVPTSDLLALRVRSLWRFFAAEGFVFWATCCYLIVEYVRPQQLFRPLYDMPVGVIVLGAALLAHLVSGRWFAMKGVGSWLLLLFSAVIVMASLTAYEPSTAFQGWRLWFSWVVIYFLIINVVNTERRLVFFTLVWLLCHYYMSQGGAKQFVLRGFRFEDYGVVGAPGWFLNSGEFGVAMCMFLAVSWHFYLAVRTRLTKWRKVFVLGMPVTAIVGIVGSSSRGAVVGLAAVGAWELLQTKHRVRGAIGVAVLAAAVWLILPPEQKERFHTAGTDYTSVQRKVYWKAGLDMARTHPVLGVGYNNWFPFYLDHYAEPRAATKEARIAQLPHNIFVHCMAELGYVGLAVLLLLIFGTLRINYQTRQLARAGRGPPNSFVTHMAHGLDGALIGYLASGFFVSVLYYPFFWINLALTVALGAIARRNLRERLAGAAAPRRPRGNATPLGPVPTTLIPGSLA